MKLIASLLTVLLLQSCGCFDWGRDSNTNESALYDPPTVHLIDGMRYHFQEGTVEGRGQKMHSHYSYQHAVILGTNPK